MSDLAPGGMDPALTQAQRARQARARAGWDPPGPHPPGSCGDPELTPRASETLDAFAGHWRLFQQRGGHRYSTDDLLAAWCALQTTNQLDLQPGTALDLGCGLGSVALWLAWLWPQLHVTGLEVQPQRLDLARRSARYNGVAERTRWLSGDLRAAPQLGTFDLVTASPPYWALSSGVLSDDPQTVACRFESVGAVEDYCQAAARALRPEGVFALVYDGRQLKRLASALDGAGLKTLRLQPVISRQGDGPLLAIAAACLPGARLTTPGDTHREPLLLRQSDGTRTPAFRALRARMGLPPGAV